MSTDSTNPIRAAMLAQNKTQADVAAALGVSRQAVQKWTPPNPTPPPQNHDPHAAHACEPQAPCALSGRPCRFPDW